MLHERVKLIFSSRNGINKLAPRFFTISYFPYETFTIMKIKTIANCKYDELLTKLISHHKKTKLIELKAHVTEAHK